jgi:hypothetical protein
VNTQSANNNGLTHLISLISREYNKQPQNQILNHENKSHEVEISQPTQLTAKAHIQVDFGLWMTAAKLREQGNWLREISGSKTKR